MASARVRRFLVGLGLALLVGGVIATSPFDALSGLSIDLLTGLRWHLLGNNHAPQDSPVVVIAIDEETYRTPPFQGTPNITWTGEIGRVLTAVIKGGASVVGFDIIFPVSLEQSTIPFGTETLGERVRGFERDYLRALAAASRLNKVVLGQVQFRDAPLRPSSGQRAAVGQQKNIRALNVHADSDDVVRRLPLSFYVDGQNTSSMAVELVARALNRPPDTPPSSVPDTVTLNFDGGADDIPTYSLADLRACIDKGDSDYFRREFAGKVVIIGTLLDVEDRRLTSKRFATGREGARAPRCELLASQYAAPVRDSLAGVYVHATAVNNLLRGDAVRELGRGWIAAISIAFALAVVTLAFLFVPVVASALWLAAALTWAAAATLTFRHALALPLLQPLIGSLATLALGIGYRFMTSDKDKRLLRQSFALYLAPAVIDRMLASSKPPELGGEAREVTVYFSDVAGFSSLSEHMAPVAIVSLMNTYLSAMTDIIEDEGGFVDKYIGDAIVAIFGAPADQPDHATRAVRAALRCQEQLAAMNADPYYFGARPLGQRIGINTGEVLVGNIGSRRRFNYTVMGDAVNLASRLEGVNKFFGTAILASDATRTAAGHIFVWREIDAIRVKGREQQVRIYEPFKAPVTAEQQASIDAYQAGLERWRHAAFAEAAERFAAANDKPGSLFAVRARRLVAEPPPGSWDGINTLEEK